MQTSTSQTAGVGLSLPNIVTSPTPKFSFDFSITTSPTSVVMQDVTMRTPFTISTEGNPSSQGSIFSSAQTYVSVGASSPSLLSTTGTTGDGLGTKFTAQSLSLCSNPSSSPSSSLIKSLSVRSPPPPPLLLVPQGHSLPLSSGLGPGGLISNCLPAPGSPSKHLAPQMSLFSAPYAGAGTGTLTVPSAFISSMPTVQITSSVTQDLYNNSSVKLGVNQRIISQAPTISLLNSGGIQQVTPPLICEQGPSAPSSPTSPGGGRLSLKKPSPLNVDALQRFDLLSPNYVPSMDYTKLTPLVSPGYSTSDLGSSPRSSISVAPHSTNWQLFRELRRNHSQAAGSDYGDVDSEAYYGVRTTDFLTPRHLLSPAPHSPLSDYGASNPGTPYFSRSPNLSPFSQAGNSLHFSFEQTRSLSSMSNRNGITAGTLSASKSPSGRRRQYRHSPIHPRSLDLNDRERSRSEGEMLKKARVSAYDDDYDEFAEDEEGANRSINQSTFSVPLRTNDGTFGGGAGAGGPTSAYKRRLLQHQSQQQYRKTSTSLRSVDSATTGGSGGPALGSIPLMEYDAANVLAAMAMDASFASSGFHLELLDDPSRIDETKVRLADPTTLLSRRPTIEESPPSPTFAEIFHSRNLDNERQEQVEAWIREQSSALETIRNTLVPAQLETNLLQVLKNMHVPQPTAEHLSQIFDVQRQAHAGSGGGSAGPTRSSILWRRSCSESDVSGDVAVVTAVPINEAAHICEHCGQGFSMRDRLTKHIASRHRDRSASTSAEKAKIHQCTLCSRSFGRSDMLTRHMRLHTGDKPYHCAECGLIFARSDHLTTHHRIHTGVKPYGCPFCSYTASRRDMITRHMRTHTRANAGGLQPPVVEIPIRNLSNLSLNQPKTPEPQPAAGVAKRHSGAVGTKPDDASMTMPTNNVCALVIRRSVSPAVARRRDGGSGGRGSSLFFGAGDAADAQSEPRAAIYDTSSQQSAQEDSREPDNASTDVDVEASSSSEEMDLDSREFITARNNNNNSDNNKHSTASTVSRTITIPSTGHSSAQSIATAQSTVAAQSLLCEIVKVPTLPQLTNTIANFTVTSDPNVFKRSNGQTSSVSDVGSVSALLMRQKMLPAGLATAPSLISLLPPKCAIPDVSGAADAPPPARIDSRDLNSASINSSRGFLATANESPATNEAISVAENVAANVLSAAMTNSHFQRQQGDALSTAPTTVGPPKDLIFTAAQLGRSSDANLLSATPNKPNAINEDQHCSAFRPLVLLNLETLSGVSTTSSHYAFGAINPIINSVCTIAPMDPMRSAAAGADGVDTTLDSLTLMSQLLSSNPQLYAQFRESIFVGTSPASALASVREYASSAAIPTGIQVPPADAVSQPDSIMSFDGLLRQNSIGGLSFRGLESTTTVPKTPPDHDSALLDVEK